MKRNFLILLSFFVLFSCGKSEPRKPIKYSTTGFYKELIAQNKKLNNREKRYLEHLIKKDSTKKYIASQSGFWYCYQQKNNSDLPYPKSGDVVTIEYNITDIFGNEIYAKQRKTYKIDKEDFIPALQDGIKLMKSKEIITFVVPSYRGYGVVGDGQKIGVN